MDELSLSPRQQHQFAILADAGHPPRKGACILDFGCGEGAAVMALRDAGFEAYGCDVVLRDTEGARRLAENGLVREIQMQPYRLPYADNTFDVVFSDQVFEHVQNYPETIAELHRVMKPGGVALHIFPSRWRFIEPHLFVPFGTWCRNRTWLKLWALLGVRNEFQTGKGADQVATENYRYLTQHTNYLPRQAVLAHFGGFYHEATFEEGLFLKHSGRGKYIYMLDRLMPGLIRLYGSVGSTVILASK